MHYQPITSPSAMALAAARFHLRAVSPSARIPVLRPDKILMRERKASCSTMTLRAGRQGQKYMAAAIPWSPASFHDIRLSIPPPLARPSSSLLYVQSAPVLLYDFPEACSSVVRAVYTWLRCTASPNSSAPCAQMSLLDIQNAPGLPLFSDFFCTLFCAIIYIGEILYSRLKALLLFPNLFIRFYY